MRRKQGPATPHLFHGVSAHLRRYAGRAFEKEEDVQKGKGALMVKGLKSMWRQAPPIVRNTLQGVLHRIIMQVGAPDQAPVTIAIMNFDVCSSPYLVPSLLGTHPSAAWS